MVSATSLTTVQAWGEEAKPDGSVRVCSYEVGVVLWPDLWSDENGTAQMVPVFGRDEPDSASETDEQSEKLVRVGFRMPYDLPLVPYGTNEIPWCNSEPCSIPDWKGLIWPGSAT